MLAALIVHMLSAPSKEAQAFEQVLLRASVLKDEPSTHKLSEVTWSPDGKWGAYTLYETRMKPLSETFGHGEMGSLCVVSRDYKTVKRLYTGHPFGGKSEDPNGCEHTLPQVSGWSQDGSRLLFNKAYPMGTVAIAGTSLHDANPRTGKIRELTKPYKDREFSLHTVGWGGSHFFSPDGKQLIIVFGQHKYSPNRHRIVLLDYKTLARRWLTPEDSFSHDPEWSPDGSQIAYSARAAKLTPEESEYLEKHYMMWGNSNRLWVMDKDGNGRRQLTYDPESSDDSPRWIDSETIQFLRSRPSVSLDHELWEVKSDGTALKKIRAVSYDEHWAWRDKNDEPTR